MERLLYGLLGVAVTFLISFLVKCVTKNKNDLDRAYDAKDGGEAFLNVISGVYIPSLFLMLTYNYETGVPWVAVVVIIIVTVLMIGINCKIYILKKHIRELEEKKECKEATYTPHEKNSICFLGIALMFGVAVILAIDYFDVLTRIGVDMTKINIDFIMNLINVIVVIVLYIVTYVMLDKRTIQRDDNKKEVADMLLQDCYVQCEKNIEFLTPEMVKDNIVPKVNLDEMLNKNPIYKNLTELPFSSEEVILELAKDGQIIARKLKLFFEIKEQYRQYINMVIICYDRPEKTKEFLNTLMEKIKETKV